MRNGWMNEHRIRIAFGVFFLLLGTILVNVELVPIGILVNLLGAIILLIGVIGAGVQAGNREVLEEVRRVGAAGDDDIHDGVEDGRL